MPLDSVEASASPRRHSLSDVKVIEANLHHQLSLMEKRRSIQELRRQNNELLANLKLNKRRRIFAKGGRAATAEEGPKVTFHCLDVNDEVEEERLQTHRRGSAPSTLLLNQINKIANSAAKAAMAGSREASPKAPRGCSTCRRRSSLPLTPDSLDPPLDKSRSLSREKAMKKRKLLRRRSAGSGDDYTMSSGKRRNPGLGCRRGSLKSSSFGGVGSPAPVPPAINLVPPKFWKHKNGVLLNHWEDRFHGGHLHNNGRRGSLPLELILC